MKHPKGMCLVSHRYQLVFYNIPKAASTTVRRLLAKIDPVISGMEGVIARVGSSMAENHFELPDRVRERYFKFAFVRDPRERFVSAFYEVCRRKPWWARSRSWYRQSDERLRFEGFLRDAEIEFCDAHVESQLYFLTNFNGTRFPLDFLGHLESFESDWRYIERTLKLPRSEIPSLNKRSCLGQLSPTPEQLSQIERLYADDFAAFGYELDTK